MTVSEIQRRFLSQNPELSWVWDILEGKQLPVTEKFTALSMQQLREIRDVIRLVREADRSASPMALLAAEQLTEKLLNGSEIKPDKYYCSSPERGKRHSSAAGITMLLFTAFMIFAFIGIMHWNAYIGSACFVGGIIILVTGYSLTDRLYKKEAPPYLAETVYHTDRLYFLKGECYLLCDKLMFSYCKDDRIPARYRDSGPEHIDHLCVPIADISYIQGKMLILSNGGAVSLYDSPQLDDMLEYISALVKWSPAPYHPSAESEKSYIKVEKGAMMKLIIAVAVLLIGVYSMPSFVHVMQAWFS